MLQKMNVTGWLTNATNTNIPLPQRQYVQKYNMQSF